LSEKIAMTIITTVYTRKRSRHRMSVQHRLESGVKTLPPSSTRSQQAIATRSH
jgi:hypothetical protein